MVSGFEVEQGALSHENIEDAAAIGIPAELGEEDVYLFVTAKPGKTLSEPQIIEFCGTVMAKFMVPKFVSILEDMPRTPTGKPQKGKLKQLALDQLQDNT